MEVNQLQAENMNHLTPLEAWELLQTEPGTLLVDIRSDMEYLFVGHPVGAVHIPWINEPSWSINENFVTEIRQLLLGESCTEEKRKGCSPVILICRSGQRSVDAGRSLLQAGLRYVAHVVEGFEGELDKRFRRSTLGGWRFHGLPWEQC
jgi:rhodanese-related sulfurtransferase